MEDKLKRIGLEVFEEKKGDYTDYPDCYDVSSSLVERLLEEDEFEDDDVEIVEYIINGSFRHYVVKVDTGNEYKIVDCSFGQFSSEYGTPVDFGDEVEDCVVVDKQRYIFE